MYSFILERLLTIGVKLNSSIDQVRVSSNIIVTTDTILIGISDGESVVEAAWQTYCVCVL